MSYASLGISSQDRVLRSSGTFCLSFKDDGILKDCKMDMDMKTAVPKQRLDFDNNLNML